MGPERQGIARATAPSLRTGGLRVDGYPARAWGIIVREDERARALDGEQG